MSLKSFITKFKLSMSLLTLEYIFFTLFLINTFYYHLTIFNLSVDDTNCILIICTVLVSLIGLYVFEKEKDRDRSKREKALSYMASLTIKDHLKENSKR